MTVCARVSARLSNKGDTLSILRPARSPQGAHKQSQTVTKRRKVRGRAPLALSGTVWRFLALFGPFSARKSAQMQAHRQSHSAERLGLLPRLPFGKRVAILLQVRRRQ